MKAKMIGSGLLSLALVSGMAAAEDVYKWVDENGITSYGETPPDHLPAELTDIRSARTDKAALQARLGEQTAVSDAVDTRKQDDREAVANAKTTKEANEQIRKQNCQLALDRQTKYDQAHRLYRAMEGGGREYLTDAELDGERAEANLAVNEWCSKK